MGWCRPWQNVFGTHDSTQRQQISDVLPLKAGLELLTQTNRTELASAVVAAPVAHASLVMLRSVKSARVVRRKLFIDLYLLTVRVAVVLLVLPRSSVMLAFTMYVPGFA